MEIKKSPKANLENKRTTLVYLGLAISVGCILAAFSYTVAIEKAESLGALELDEVVETLIPVTAPPPEKMPPPPPPPAVTEMIEIVDDETELDDEFEMMDTDADDETAIEIQSIEEAPEEVETEEIFNFVEDKAEFPGGDAALLKFLGKNVKYPSIAAENGVSGKVNVQFIINKDGSVEGATVMRPVNPALDKEALRVVNSMPRWKPGMQGGKPVRMYYRVPINFQLQN